MSAKKKVRGGDPAVKRYPSTLGNSLGLEMLTEGVKLLEKSVAVLSLPPKNVARKLPGRF